MLILKHLMILLPSYTVLERESSGNPKVGEYIYSGK